MAYTAGLNTQVVDAIIDALGIKGLRCMGMTIDIPVRGPVVISIKSPVPVDVDAKIAEAVRARLEVVEVQPEAVED